MAATADTLQAVELADGVEIHLRVAGPAVRSAAWFLDVLLYAGIMLVAIFAVSMVLGNLVGQLVAQGVLMLAMFIGNWFYNIGFEMSRMAATPGQRAMGLKVSSVSGGPVKLSQSVIRNLLRVVDMMPLAYLLGFVCCLFTRRFQRLGDMVADTVVVYSEPPNRPMPEHQVNAEPLAPPVSLSREEQAALLEFLERAPNWSDARKTEVSDLLIPLTERAGLAGLIRVCGFGLWIRHGGKAAAPPAPQTVFTRR